MGDLYADSAVFGAGGAYTATLSEDWRIWGPAGGYIVAVLLRAAGAQATLPRPASLACHFLGVAAFGEVQLSTETVRGSKRAESIRARMTQDDRPIAEALVWVTTGEPGVEHDWAQAPDVPPPASLPPLEALLSPEQIADGYPFWRNFEERPTRWIEDWENREPMEPRWRQWMRLLGSAPPDPFCDAARLAALLDVSMWPAAVAAHRPRELHHIAPSLDLHAVFHRLCPEAEWLLIDGHGPVGADGLVGGTARVWAEDGTLLASGGQQMLSRPMPPRG